jgi:hypothetical protein
MYRRKLITHKRTRALGRRLGSMTLALGLGFTVNAQAEVHAGAFEMLVFEDSSMGRHLIEGDLGAALSTNETRSLSRFSALNDRCVSLTLAGELEKAEVVCNDALREARRSNASGAPGYSGRGAMTDTRSRRAMAFTNRGVLHALQGKGERAKDDFRTAVTLSARLSAAAGNLEVLEDRPAMASAD